MKATLRTWDYYTRRIHRPQSLVRNRLHAPLWMDTMTTTSPRKARFRSCSRRSREPQLRPGMMPPFVGLCCTLLQPVKTLNTLRETWLENPAVSVIRAVDVQRRASGEGHCREDRVWLCGRTDGWKKRAGLPAVLKWRWQDASPCTWECVSPSHWGGSP